MGKYFTIQEMCRSLEAQELGVVNAPSKAQQDNIENFIKVILDPIREAWGKPITVSSGFRNKAVNKAVGGVSNSHHLFENGYCAADITAGSEYDNERLYGLIRKLDLPICQCIDEYGYSWIHVSYHPTDVRRHYFKET